MGVNLPHSLQQKRLTLDATYQKCLADGVQEKTAVTAIAKLRGHTGFQVTTVLLNERVSRPSYHH